MPSYLPNEYTYSKEGTDTKEPGNRINSYLAVLIVTMFGALMTLLIVRVIYSNATVIIYGNDAVIYTYLPVALPINRY